MALKAKITDLADVEESQRALYRKLDDGSGYIVDVAPVDGFNLENVGGLTSALEKSKRQIKEANDILKELGDTDPATIKRKLTRYEEIKDLDEAQMKKQVTQDVREAVAKEFQDEIKTMAEKHDKLVKSLKQSALESVKTAIAKEHGEPEFIRAYLNDTVQVEIDEDGRHRLQFMRDDGVTPRIKVKDGQQTDFGVDDFIQELKTHETYGKIFASQAASGSGGPKNYQNPGKGEEVVTKDQLSTGNATLEDFAKRGVVSNS
jgi:gas vesicle protein